MGFGEKFKHAGGAHCEAGTCQCMTLHLRNTIAEACRLLKDHNNRFIREVYDGLFDSLLYE